MSNGIEISFREDTTTHSWYCGFALLLAPTVAALFWNKGGWIQNRANTLATWCMFAQVFPLFQDASIFSVIPSLYADGFMDPAIHPTLADPRAGGVVAVLSILINLAALVYIIKRSKAGRSTPTSRKFSLEQRTTTRPWPAPKRNHRKGTAFSMRRLRPAAAH